MQMTGSECEFLSSLITGKNYLEIGAGKSTSWAANYAELLHSVECRKDWYKLVQKETAQQENVTVFLFEPEAVAYTEEGEEIWCHGRHDYGTEEEFSSYIQKIKKLVLENTYHVILVDGMVREELVYMLKEVAYKNIILVHDISSRNPPTMGGGGIPTSIFDIEGILELRSTDTLYALRIE